MHANLIALEVIEVPAEFWKPLHPFFYLADLHLKTVAHLRHLIAMVGAVEH